MKQVNYKGRDLEAMACAKNYYHWVMNEFKPYLKGNVGEVGAGSGNFSSLVIDNGVHCFVTVEPSEEMYPVLASKFIDKKNVRCRKAVFADIHHEYVNYFDAMVYVNVLEHIQDDRQELRLVYDSLREGGYICIFVPALPWLYSEFDSSVGHHRRYYKKQLVTLVEEAGFKTVKASYFDILGIVPWFLIFKLLKSRLTAESTNCYDKIIIPTLEKIESWFHVPIGKNIVLVAKKVSKPNSCT